MQKTQTHTMTSEVREVVSRALTGYGARLEGDRIAYDEATTDIRIGVRRGRLLFEATSYDTTHVLARGPISEETVAGVVDFYLVLPKTN